MRRDTVKSDRAGAVVVAAGSGTRLGASSPKALIPLAGVPMLAYSLAVFEELPEIEDVVVVLREEDVLLYMSDVAEVYDFRKVSRVVPGGARRQDSTRAGLAALDPRCNVVLVHDAARPLADASLVRRCLDALIGAQPTNAGAAIDAANTGAETADATSANPAHRETENVRGAIGAKIGPTGAGGEEVGSTGPAPQAARACVVGVVPVVSVVDTLKRVEGEVVRETVDRTSLVRVQTPQAFLRAVLEDAHRRAAESGVDVTDDAALVERAGGVVRYVAGDEANLKVTYALDVTLAEAIIAARGVTMERRIGGGSGRPGR
jgi:2-C-methyl-D-erythritol 4-phosphate cytidylyltransferase